MFESTVELLDRLCTKLATENATGVNNELVQEDEEKAVAVGPPVEVGSSGRGTRGEQHQPCREAFIRHVDNVFWSGLDIEAVPQPEDTRATREEAAIHRSSIFDLELFTECFYYISHRLLTLLRKSKPIPGLESVMFRGANYVRNKLLEHVEGKDSLVFNQSLAWGKENGPVLKAARWAGQEHVFPDKGLYVNAAEIKDNLEVILKRLLNEPRAPGGHSELPS